MSDFVLLLDSSKTPQDSDNFEINFNSPIRFNGIPHEVALKQIATWFTWFNINTEYGNNIFKYSPDSGANWFTETIPSGNYSVSQLEEAIHTLMENNTHVNVDGTYDINLIPNYSTIKLYIELKGTFQVDLTVGNLRNIFGFTSMILTDSAYGSSNVNITNSVNTMLVHCSLVNGAGSFDNNISSDIIYSFVPSVPPGASISISPVSVTYIPIDRLDNMDRVRIRLSDQLGRRINLNGEHLSVWLHVRPRKMISYNR
jgi:hypothetical protein